MRKYVFGFVLGVFFLSFGCCFLAVELSNYDFLGNMGESLYSKVTKKEIFSMNAEKFYFTAPDASIEIKIDNELKEEILIESLYVKEFGEMIVRTVHLKNQKKIQLDYKTKVSLEEIKKLGKQIVKDMSEKQYYDYLELFRPKITIYVHEKYRNRIEVGE